MSQTDTPDVAAASSLLATQGAAIVSLCRALPEALASGRPPGGGWSAAFVISHLLDEERLDFRVRLRSTLADPARTWPAIDPEGWVEKHTYRARDWTADLDAFEEERRTSVAWVRDLGGSPWDATHAHSSLGAISARDLLSAWLDHDRVHLRQLLRILHDLGESVVPAGRPDYAGGSW